MSKAGLGIGFWGQAPAPAVDPEAYRRIGHAAATWLGLTLAAIAILSVGVIWHLVRRGRLIRERLGPPRAVQLPELEPGQTKSQEGASPNISESQSP
jgi:hypothetical protein